MDFSPIIFEALGITPNLKDPLFGYAIKVFHATTGPTLKAQLETWAAAQPDEVLALLVDARGSNAGGVYELQLGTVLGGDGVISTNLWTWEVFEDSSATGMQAQIDRWLAAIRADESLITPILTLQSQAGRGDGTRFVTVLAWVDIGGEVETFGAALRAVRDARLAIEPEPEPEPEPPPE